MRARRFFAAAVASLPFALSAASCLQRAEGPASDPVAGEEVVLASRRECMDACEGGPGAMRAFCQGLPGVRCLWESCLPHSVDPEGLCKLWCEHHFADQRLRVRLTLPTMQECLADCRRPPWVRVAFCVSLPPVPCLQFGCWTGHRSSEDICASWCRSSFY